MVALPRDDRPGKVRGIFCLVMVRLAELVVTGGQPRPRVSSESVETIRDCYGCGRDKARSPVGAYSSDAPRPRRDRRVRAWRHP